MNSLENTIRQLMTEAVGRNKDYYIAKNAEKKRLQAERNAIKAEVAAKTQQEINAGKDRDAARASALDTLGADPKFQERAASARMGKVGRTESGGGVLSYQNASAAERAQKAADRASGVRGNDLTVTDPNVLANAEKGRREIAAARAQDAEYVSRTGASKNQRVGGLNPVTGERPDVSGSRTSGYINPNSPQGQILAKIKSGEMESGVLDTTNPEHKRVLSQTPTEKLDLSMYSHQDVAKSRGDLSKGFDGDKLGIKPGMTPRNIDQKIRDQARQNLPATQARLEQGKKTLQGMEQAQRTRYGISDGSNVSF